MHHVAKRGTFAGFVTDELSTLHILTAGLLFFELRHYGILQILISNRKKTCHPVHSHSVWQEICLPSSWMLRHSGIFLVLFVFKFECLIMHSYLLVQIRQITHTTGTFCLIYLAVIPSTADICFSNRCSQTLINPSFSQETRAGHSDGVADLQLVEGDVREHSSLSKPLPSAEGN